MIAQKVGPRNEKGRPKAAIQKGEKEDYLISRRRVGGTVSTFLGMVSFSMPSVYSA